MYTRASVELDAGDHVQGACVASITGNWTIGSRLGKPSRRQDAEVTDNYYLFSSYYRPSYRMHMYAYLCVCLCDAFSQKQ